MAKTNITAYDMQESFKHKFAKKPEVIEGNMKALDMALKEVEQI
jgi:pyruvate ferredoxin oxidoreductase gamma subunit